MDREALYAGSFDPITLGHLDVVETALQDFDKVHVALIKNPIKPTQREILRYSLVENVLKKMNNVFVHNLLKENVLTINVAQTLGVNTLIRGVKGVTNMEEEMQIAFNNYHLAPSIHTVWYPVKQEHYHISSSVVRTILQCYPNIDVLDYVKNVQELREILGLYLPESIIEEVISNKAAYQ